jgi:hypothetical protein
MKKNVFVYAIVAAIVALAGWNVSQSRNEVALSDVALANVEALAEETGSTGSTAISCFNYGCRFQINYYCTVYGQIWPSGSYMYIMTCDHFKGN